MGGEVRRRKDSEVIREVPFYAIYYKRGISFPLNSISLL